MLPIVWHITQNIPQPFLAFHRPFNISYYECAAHVAWLRTWFRLTSIDEPRPLLSYSPQPNIIFHHATPLKIKDFGHILKAAPVFQSRFVLAIRNVGAIKHKMIRILCLLYFASITIEKNNVHQLSGKGLRPAEAAKWESWPTVGGFESATLTSAPQELICLATAACEQSLKICINW